MFRSLVGSKIGMTQIFDTEKKIVVPVTAVKIGHLYVTQIKTLEKDGYAAVQIGSLKDRYVMNKPSKEWFLQKRKYFSFLKEVSVSNLESDALAVGQLISVGDFGIKTGDTLKVSGTGKGLGFQGCMRRHGFGGGPKSHGSTFHRAPGGIGSIRMKGEVFKGKRLPGRMGGASTSVKSVVQQIDVDNGCVFLKGSLPGKKGFLLELYAR